MAGGMMRFKWWLQNRLSFHQQDLFIVLAFLTCAFIIMYSLLLKYEDPDVTDLRGDLGDNEVLIKQALKEAGVHEKWLMDPKLIDREREHQKFQSVQEKIKRMGGAKPPKHKFDPDPVNPITEPEKVAEDESKLALQDEEKDIVKDKEYWLNKYEHVFHRGFEMDIQAPVDDLKGGKAHCTVYNHQSPVNASYECVKLKVKQKPTICLYPPSVDVHISKYIRKEGTWEPHIVKLVTEYLNMDPNLGFIDIGANIGVYTLTAAILGHKVVAIEPYEENLKHLSQGIQLSHLENNVIVLQNAVSDKRLKFMDLRLDPNNQGGIQVDDSNDDYGCYGENCPPQVKSILMNDILEVTNFKSAIIKIDIEGHEHRAFREAQELFDHLYIPCIVMEWIKLKDYYGTELDQTEDKIMVHELVDFLTEQGYQAYSMVTNEKLIPDYWFAWPDDVVWKHLLVRET